MSNLRQRVFILLLLFVFAILQAASLLNSPQPAQANGQNDWELRNARITLPDLETNPVNLSTMKVSIVSGRVSCSFNGPFSVDLGKGVRYAGNMRITMDGTYSDSAGMSGTYTYTITGTLSFEGKSGPWNGHCSSSFTGPGGMVDGGTYTVSFAGCTGSGDSAEDSVDPFKIYFTAFKQQSSQTPQPAQPSQSAQGNMENWKLGPGMKIISISNPSPEQSGLTWVQNTSPGLAKITYEDPDASCAIYVSNGTKIGLRPLPPDKDPLFKKNEPLIVLGLGYQIPKADKVAGVINGIKATVKIKKAGSIVSVAASKAVLKIKGTEFVLEDYGDSSVVKVIQGAVEVTGISNGKTAVLSEGEKCTCTDSTLNKEKFSVTTEQAKWSTEGASPGAANSPQTAGQSDNANKRIKIGPLSCFIATAAYGSETAAQLDILRAFRDRVLMHSKTGRWLVDIYYQLSPPIAEFIAEHEQVRIIVRESILDPIVNVLNNTEQYWNK